MSGAKRSQGNRPGGRGNLEGKGEGIAVRGKLDDADNRLNGDRTYSTKVARIKRLSRKYQMYTELVCFALLFIKRKCSRELK